MSANLPPLLPCPFCGNSPRHLEHKAGFYTERAICDGCGFHLAPEVWNRRAAIEADRVSRDVPAGYVKASESMDVRRLYATLCDVVDEANAVDTVIGRPQVLYEKLRRLRDEIGSATNCQIPLAASPQPQPVQAQPSKAVADMLAERQRQISVEGYDHAHDDAHDGIDGGRGLTELERAAKAYIEGDVYNWPWHSVSFKPSTPRRNLIKASALLLAEIERLDRAEQAQKEE